MRKTNKKPNKRRDHQTVVRVVGRVEIEIERVVNEPLKAPDRNYPFFTESEQVIPVLPVTVLALIVHQMWQILLSAVCRAKVCWTPLMRDGA